MKEEKIQTLHPLPGKTNKSISTEKYNFIKKHLLAVLAKKELTHTELMEALYQKVKDVASIIVMDQQTLKLEPWDKSVMGKMEKAVYDSGLGLTPMNQ